MNCPKCGTLMRKEGLAGLQGESVFFTLECPNCHCRLEMPVSKTLKRKELHLR